MDEGIAGHVLEGLVDQVERGGVVARLERVASPVKRLVSPFLRGRVLLAVRLGRLGRVRARQSLSVDDASEDVLAYASPVPVP